MKKIAAAIFSIGAFAAASAFAQMTPGGIGMQPPNSALAEEVHWFHNILLMPIITVISLFVLGLLIWIAVRYNAKANPTPRQFSHNTMIEIVWTVIPILILLVIALPSFELLYKEDVMPDGKQIVAQGDGQTVDFVFANDFDSEHRRVLRNDHVNVLINDGATTTELEKSDYKITGTKNFLQRLVGAKGDDIIQVSLNNAPSTNERVFIRGGRTVIGGSVTLAPTVTLKVNGYQWGWTYSYPDFGDFEYSSNMLPDDQVPDPMLRKLEVDNRVVVPVGETVRVVVTARDVIHAWALPAFAIKIDAVPGRINETWFNADREGVFYGQCSEICGIKHSFMPIAVEVVSRPAFEAWVDEQRALAQMDPIFGDAQTKLADAASGADENQGAQ